MRSELIFRAKETVENKYQLSRTASKATRRLHISATNTTDTINNAFDRIAGGYDASTSGDSLAMPSTMTEASIGVWPVRAPLLIRRQ
jgi:hypothetical protein